MTRLCVSALSIRRNGATLLANVGFTASGGEFIGLVGPNGSGKTTLLRALAGFEAGAAPAVLIDGMALGALAPRQRALKIAYLPQQREVAFAINAEAVVALGRFAFGAPHRLGPAGHAAVNRALDATDANAFRFRTMATLSGGEQARVHLARALAAEAPILLADEPTAALDPRHQRAIMTALRDKADAGGLVIAALHDLALARRLCSRLIILDRGAIVADAPATEALTADIVEKVFGLGLHEL
ncbi:MAG: ABC transporter ATP-binding protein [Parvularculaceae bacterium]